MPVEGIGVVPVPVVPPVLEQAGVPSPLRIPPIPVGNVFPGAIVVPPLMLSCGLDGFAPLIVRPEGMMIGFSISQQLRGTPLDAHVDVFTSPRELLK